MQVIILGDPIDYKGFHILIQAIGNTFQAIMFHRKEKNYYQIHNHIQYAKGRNRFNTEELTNAYKYMMAQAQVTCELILHKDNPEELTEEAKRQIGDDEKGKAMLQHIQAVKATGDKLLN